MTQEQIKSIPKSNDNYCPECQKGDMFKRFGLTCCEGCCGRK